MKKIGRLYFLVALWCVLTFNVSAQERKCSFDEPDVIREQYQIERLLNEGEETEILQIRVVFHVVYQDGEQNISDDQILSQLKVLNQDYQKTNPDSVNVPEIFKPLSANCKLQFVLAQQDEDGVPTNGITRTQTTHGPFGNSDIHFSSLGGKDAWNADKYLNIWVCNLAPGVLGYATPPGTTKEKDGVVIHFENIGTLGTAKAPYQGGRTLTHEVGHYLGLQHIWGVAGDCDDDDGIEDTPLQAGAIHDCSESKFSCGSQDMLQNFMNLAQDDCLNFFTRGQATFMRSILLNERKGVIDTSTLVLNIKEGSITESLLLVPVNGQKAKYELKGLENASIKSIAVFSHNGASLFRKDFSGFKSPQELEIDLKGYSAGLYFIRIATSEKIYTKRILHLL